MDLAAIHHNAGVLVSTLAPLGIAVTGVTKAVLGSPAVAGAMLDAGVARLGESRVENLERLRGAGITAETMLIRSPMRSQVDRVVAVADISCVTEASVVEALSAAAMAAGTVHRLVVMVDLGDRREGVLPDDLVDAARRVLELPGVRLHGIGTNLACQNGVCPDLTNMAQLSDLADRVEAALGVELVLVSGGNSANLEWALSDPAVGVGRINDLRLGESILLGRETLHRHPVPGLRVDAASLFAEVIESKVKPSTPVGRIAQTAFGWAPPGPLDEAGTARTIVAIGHQDTDPAGLDPPLGTRIVGASSDHLVVSSPTPLEAGAEIRFGVDYSALLRAMTSPFVEHLVEPRADVRAPAAG
nr:alanine/ornithine racemase family PLP-dependent enzyme [Rhabdothermincola salaria]